jgi:anthranilate synthase/aminodeoxychorismate synthase-like glutamine amidotransferase
MARVLVLDNHDSFTWNLVHELELAGARCTVVASDAIDLAGVKAFFKGISAGGVLISPGPCTPDEAGASLEVLRSMHDELPILGVCLGHQAIGQAFGGRVVRAKRPMHGKTSSIQHDGRTVFAGLPTPFTATRYNSLLVERESLPACLAVSAWTEGGEIMGVRHRDRPIEGVQFHPESILSESARPILASWARSLEAR